MKCDLQWIKRILGQNIFEFFLKKFKSLLRPWARVSPKMPPGSQTSDFARSKIFNLYCAEITCVFCLNFGKVEQINQGIWAKKDLFGQNGHFWVYLALKVPRGV